MLKLSDPTNLTPIEKEMNRSHDFVKNLAVTAALQSVISRLEEAEIALRCFEEDPEAAADHAAIIPIIKKEVAEAEIALVEFAKISAAHGISA